MSKYLITCERIYKAIEIDEKLNNLLVSYYPEYRKNFTQGIYVNKYHNAEFMYIPYEKLKSIINIIKNTTIIVLVDSFQTDNKWRTNLYITARTETVPVTAQKVFDELINNFPIRY